jgi:hypothetical protein
MGEMIRGSCRNVRHKYANHSKKVLDRYYEELPKEEQQLLDGLGRRPWDWFNHILHLPIA